MLEQPDISGQIALYFKNILQSGGCNKELKYSKNKEDVAKIYFIVVDDVMVIVVVTAIFLDLIVTQFRVSYFVLLYLEDDFIL